MAIEKEKKKSFKTFAIGKPSPAFEGAILFFVRAGATRSRVGLHDQLLIPFGLRPLSRSKENSRTYCRPPALGEDSGAFRGCLPPVPPVTI